MRTYSARVTALALGVSVKWMDNLLSHFDVPGVERCRQGKAREISDEGLLAIEFLRALNADLGIPIGRAADIATSAMATRHESSLAFTSPAKLQISLSIADVESRVRNQMVEAVEAAGYIRRGRPKTS